MTSTLQKLKVKNIYAELSLFFIFQTWPKFIFSHFFMISKGSISLFTTYFQAFLFSIFYPIRIWYFVFQPDLNHPCFSYLIYNQLFNLVIIATTNSKSKLTISSLESVFSNFEIMRSLLELHTWNHQVFCFGSTCKME
jgi:hypothetical protein